MFDWINNDYYSIIDIWTFLIIERDTVMSIRDCDLVDLNGSFVAIDEGSLRDATTWEGFAELGTIGVRFTEITSANFV